MDEELTSEEGKEITRELLHFFNLEKVDFRRKEITSRYYAPGTEYEAFVQSPRSNKWIEIADFGMYSPLALSRYDIEYPVLNVGLGVERLGMILSGVEDIRRFAYPQFYAEWKLSDDEIARMISIDKKPTSEDGAMIVSKIVEVAKIHANDSSPCEVIAYRGMAFGREVEVYLYEKDPNTKLLGPAAMNEVYVYDGNILGIPPRGLETELVRKTREKGVGTGITFLAAISSLAAYKMEKVAKMGGGSVDVRVKLAKAPSDVNVAIGSVARRYITSTGRRIVLKGPVFLGIKAMIH
jgi:O-phosphoseryl-tRNA synthetase